MAIFGAGPETPSLLQALRPLGWHVSVVERRARWIPDTDIADAWLMKAPDDALRALQPAPDAALVMHQNSALEVALFAAPASSPMSGEIRTEMVQVTAQQGGTLTASLSATDVDGAITGIAFWDPKDAGLAMNKVAKLLLDGKTVTDGMDLGIKGYDKVKVTKGPGAGLVVKGQAWSTPTRATTSSIRSDAVAEIAVTVTVIPAQAGIHNAACLYATGSRHPKGTSCGALSPG